MNEIMIITVDSTLDNSTCAKRCAGTCTKKA